MSARYGLCQEDAPLLPPTPIKVPKRAMFLLDALYKAGAEGITTIEFPGVRVSAGILHLRRAGRRRADHLRIAWRRICRSARAVCVEKPRRADHRRSPSPDPSPTPLPLDRHGGAMSGIIRLVR